MGGSFGFLSATGWRVLRRYNSPERTAPRSGWRRGAVAGDGGWIAPTCHSLVIVSALREELRGWNSCHKACSCARPYSCAALLICAPMIISPRKSALPLQERMLERRTIGVVLLEVNQLVRDDRRQSARVAVHFRADEQAVLRRCAAGIEPPDREVHVGEDRGGIDRLQPAEGRSNSRVGARDVDMRRPNGVVPRPPVSHHRRQILGAHAATRDKIAHADRCAIEVFTLEIQGKTVGRGVVNRVPEEPCVPARAAVNVTPSPGS